MILHSALTLKTLISQLSIKCFHNLFIYLSIHYASLSISAFFTILSRQPLKICSCLNLRTEHKLFIQYLYTD